MERARGVGDRIESDESQSLIHASLRSKLHTNTYTNAYGGEKYARRYTKGLRQAVIKHTVLYTLRQQV